LLKVLPDFASLSSSLRQQHNISMVRLATGVLEVSRPPVAMVTGATQAKISLV